MSTSQENPVGKRQVPVEEGLFYQPQSPGEQPYLIANRCRVCGYTCFPRLITDCPRCQEHGTMEMVHLAGKGKLDTFSTCNAALPGFPAPTIQGYVLIGGARLWSQITDTEMSGAELKSGMDVELVIAKLRDDADGNEVVSYKFRPVKK
jgi:uncharacterized OB-fold protein